MLLMLFNCCYISRKVSLFFAFYHLPKTHKINHLQIFYSSRTFKYAFQTEKKESTPQHEGLSFCKWFLYSGFYLIAIIIPKEFPDAERLMSYPFVKDKTCKAQRVLCHCFRHDGLHPPFLPQLRRDVKF